MGLGEGLVTGQHSDVTSRRAVQRFLMTPLPPAPLGSVPSSGKLGGQQRCWSGPAPTSFSRVSRRPPWMGRLTAAVWNIY